MYISQIVYQNKQKYKLRKPTQSDMRTAIKACRIYWTFINGLNPIGAERTIKQLRQLKPRLKEFCMYRKKYEFWKKSTLLKIGFDKELVDLLYKTKIITCYYQDKDDYINYDINPIPYYAQFTISNFIDNLQVIIDRAKQPQAEPQLLTFGTITN